MRIGVCEDLGVSITWVQMEGECFPPSWNNEPSTHPVASLNEDLTSSTHHQSWLTVRRYYEAQSRSWAAWVREQVDYAKCMKFALTRVEMKVSDRILEVASGSTPLNLDLPQEAFVVTTDVSFQMLLESKSSTSVVCDVRELPFRSDYFDVVLGLNPVIFVPEAIRVSTFRAHVILAYTYGKFSPVYIAPEKRLEQFPENWHCKAGRGPWGEYQIYSKL
jgi:hypothetical protein